MTCYLCESAKYSEILRKEDVAIWTDSSDDESLRYKYKCSLHQCLDCGHVYQPVDDELRKIFNQIYVSTNAQGPSSMGIGKWGIERANQHFFDVVDFKNYKSALEIGCGDGYLLKRLKSAGFNRLIGIEPSLNIGKNIEGITFINKFLNETSDLIEKVDFIYSVAVFEHIENINAVLSFCRNHLKAGGELFFVVPNAQSQLAEGDPALFVHQHVHYFTETSLKYLLLKNGFQINSIVSKEDGFYVLARIGAFLPVKPTQINLYKKYQDKLNRILSNLQNLFSKEIVIVHGACNALNNISGWIKGDFHLADNDEKKQGKKYFNKTVMSPFDFDLSKYKTILIIPRPYFTQIKEQYLKRGFHGNILGIDLT